MQTAGTLAEIGEQAGQAAHVTRRPCSVDALERFSLEEVESLSTASPSAPRGRRRTPLNRIDVDGGAGPVEPVENALAPQRTPLEACAPRLRIARAVPRVALGS